MRKDNMKFEKKILINVICTTNIILLNYTKFIVVIL